MATKCFAQVRGSAIRVTELGRVGQVSNPVRFAVSRNVARVEVVDQSEAGSTELVRGEGKDNDFRAIFRREANFIRSGVNIDFVKVDPGVLSLVTGVPVNLNAAGDVAGFSSRTRKRGVAFALEVWTNLSEDACENGTRLYGYTLFPFLWGGNLSGFSFAGGLVSFNLRGAQTRRGSRWGVGPHDLTGTGVRLQAPVSRNSQFLNFIGPYPPPPARSGVQEETDVIDGGTASFTSDDVIDGQFVITSEDIIDGGRAV